MNRGWWLEAKESGGVGEMMAIRECGIKKRAADDYNGAAYSTQKRRWNEIYSYVMSSPLFSSFASTLMLSTLTHTQGLP